MDRVSTPKNINVRLKNLRTKCQHLLTKVSTATNRMFTLKVRSKSVDTLWTKCRHPWLESFLLKFKGISVDTPKESGDTFDGTINKNWVLIWHFTRLFTPSLSLQKSSKPLPLPTYHLTSHTSSWNSSIQASNNSQIDKISHSSIS